MEVFVCDEERLAVRRDGEMAGTGALTLRDDMRIGVAFEELVEREEDDAGIGKTDGNHACIGDDDDALCGLAAERLPCDAFELGAFDAEDLDAGLNRMLARDGN